MFTPERIKDVARIYAHDEYAAQALGITRKAFQRICKRFDIETPNQRFRRLHGHTPRLTH